MDTDRLQPRLHRHLAIQAARLLERNAEFVDVQSCRDVRVRAGVDVGIDADRHPGTHTSRLRRAVDALQLARGLGVDGFQAELHRPFDLVRRFANAAEHDIGRWKPGPHRQIDFADGVGIDGAAGLVQEAQYCERRVRLHGVVDPMRMRLKRLVQLAVRLPNRLGAVDVERGTMVARDVFERNTIARECIVLSKETDHA